MDARCRIQLLGGLRVTQGERVISRFQTQKTGALLAYLAYHLQQSHPREVLIELLWPEGDPEAGRNGLRVALSSLRRQLEPPGVPAGALLQTDFLSARLNKDIVCTDVSEFETALRLAKSARSPVDVRQYLEQAVDLYTGRLLPGYYQDWIAPEQDYLANRYYEAVRQVASLLEQAGEMPAALECVRRAVSLDTFREEAHQDLIRLLAANGQREAALRQYRQLEQTLQQELGQAPSPVTIALVRQIERMQPQERDRAPAAFPSIQDAALSSRSETVAPDTAAPPIGTLTFLLIEFLARPAGELAVGETFQHALAACRSALRRVLRAHGGHKVKESASTFTIVFGRASDALACAVSFQRMLAKQADPQTGQDAPVRMALDTREIRSKEGIGQEATFKLATRLLAAARSGQILCAESTALLLRRELDPEARLVNLGIYRFRGLSAPERVFQVEYPGMPQSRFPALNAEAGYTTHLPPQFTRFFGREKESAWLQERLLAESTRLVTLTGPGGTGKTRLALEVAARLVEPFQGAVWFVPLADLRDARLIVGATVESMHLPPTAGRDPLNQIVEALSRQPSLLILDNFEQLVEEGAPIVRGLLERISSLTCLVTSRQSLNLDGETIFKLTPLPAPQGAHSPEQLILFESVRLFVDRVQAVRPDFQVTQGNAAAIAELCNRLEGIPLALELAAARASVMTPAQMLGELSRRFDFLVSRRRDVADRHRTLRATIDWSYQGLPPDLQRFFARLWVFRGGWTVEATAAVCAEPLALAQLQMLQESSLVLTEETPEGMRFRLLETLREYAGEQLEEAERVTLQQRHGEYYLGLAEQAEQKLGGKEMADWLERLESEHDNFRAVLAWTQTGADHAEQGLRLGAALWKFWCLRAHGPEGYRWLAEALANPGAQHRTKERARALNAAAGIVQRYINKDLTLKLARSLYQEALEIGREQAEASVIAASLLGLGVIAWWESDTPSATASWRESMDCFRKIGDLSGIAEALGNLGKVARDAGDYETAIRYFEESQDCCRQAGDNLGAAQVTDELGGIALVRREIAAALRCYQESLAVYREAGAKRSMASTLHVIGQANHLQGSLAAARSAFEESAALSRDLHMLSGEASTLNSLGLVAYRQGDYAAAQAFLTRSLRLWHTAGYVGGTAAALERLAGLAAARGHCRRAACLFGAAHTIREALSSPVASLERADYDHDLQAACAGITEETFAAAWAGGQAMSVEQAVEYALGDRDR